MPIKKLPGLHPTTPDSKEFATPFPGTVPTPEQFDALVQISQDAVTVHAEGTETELPAKFLVLTRVTPEEKPALAISPLDAAGDAEATGRFFRRVVRKLLKAKRTPVAAGVVAESWLASEG
jgi:hypothetical protein